MCSFWQAMAPVAAVLLMHMTAEVSKCIAYYYYFDQLRIKSSKRFVNLIINFIVSWKSVGLLLGLEELVVCQLFLINLLLCHSIIITSHI